MYDILRPINGSHGNYKERTTVSLKGVPNEVLTSWESSGLIRRRSLSPMPEETTITVSNGVKLEEAGTPADTKRTTYERKRR